jgi:hypothetical protein
LTLLWGLSACRKAEFEPIEPTDSGTPHTDALPDADPNEFACEDPNASSCTPAACEPICHKRSGPIANTGDQCTVYFSGGNPARYDNCKPGNVCLSPQNGGSIFYCFALCADANSCTSRAACAGRLWSGSTQVKVCDPAPQSCASSCCDPIAPAGCDSGRYCYLIAPRSDSQDSWTVCDYSTGDVGRGDPCTTSRDCFPGLACYFGSSASTTGACRQVCLPTDENACSGGGTCTRYGAQFGVCL